MGKNCAPLVADLFLFCYERDVMKNLSSDNQTDVIEAFNSTSRYLDDILNIDNPYFEGMVNQIYNATIQNNRKIDRIHNSELYIATVSIKHKSADRIKTALRFWLNATR